MAITDLDPLLLAAQDSVHRHPLIELKAGQFVDDIPFDGQRIDEQTQDESNPCLITHSSGRLCGVNVLSNGHIQYIYTDVDRLQFNYVDTCTDEITEQYAKNVEDVAICEMANGDIALVWISNDGYYARYGVLTPVGVWVRKGNIPGISGASTSLSAPAITRMADGTYLAMLLKDLPLTVTRGGTYTGTTDSTISLKITADGTETTALFQWRKDQGAWSANIVATGNSQAIIEGVTVDFGTGQYFTGQEFWFNVMAATAADGAVVINSVPVNGQQLVIGATTYTFREALTLPAVANEIKIDTMSRDITAENLHCALMGTTFEGTGVGVRYSTGTIARTDLTAVRTDNRVDLTSVLKGSGVYIGVFESPSANEIECFNVTGGESAGIGVLSGTASNIIQKVTSVDIQNWGIWSDFYVPGITSTRNKTNLFLTKLQNDKVMLWFDIMTQGEGTSTAVYNVLYTESADNGGAWTDAIQVTNYTLPGTVGKNPKMVQRLATEIILVYDEVRSCLRMTKETPGWDTNENLSPISMHHDDATGMLYAMVGYTGAGLKNLHGAIKINTSTWQIAKFWNDKTIPAMSPWFTTTAHSARRCRGGGKWLAVTCHDFSASGVLLIDGETDTIYQLFFNTVVEYNLNKNVDGNFFKSIAGYDWVRPAVRCFIDTVNQRLWVAFSTTIGSNDLRIGYLDLAQFGQVGTENYSFTEVINEENLLAGEQLTGFDIFAGDFRVYPEAGLIAVSGIRQASDWFGWLRLWDLESGAVYRYFTKNTHPNFPYRGLNTMTYANGKIFGGFEYEPLYGNADRRGMVEIDLASEYIYYRTPNFLSVDGLGIIDILTTQDSNIIMTLANLGVAVYGLNTGMWTLYNNDNVPGMYPGTDTVDIYVGPIAYDNANSMIYFGNSDPYVYTPGLTGFSVYGRLERSYYNIAQDPSGAGWVFEGENPLVAGITDSDAAVALEPGTNAIYAFWSKYSRGTMKTYWDKESGLLDLKDYVLRGQEISHTRTIDGTPAELKFSLSNGHQFDPSNVGSLLSSYIKKGKKIQLRYGERVGGIDYWQAGAATFVVCSTGLTYRRGEYPVLSVTCEDRRRLWDEIRVVATPRYETTYPDAVLKDAITKYGGFAINEIDIAPLDGGVALKIQYVDKSLKDIVTSIAHRFGYFIDVTPNGDQVVCRKMDLNKDPDHVYVGSQWLEDFTPDDSFSNFTNRVTVQGQSDNDIQVLYAEERVAGDSGTVGFWKRKNTKRIYYSEDKSRRCLNPRLEVQESASSIAFALAGKIKEYISYEDPDHKFVDVKIEAPDLTPELLAGLASYLAGKSMPPSMKVVTNTGGGTVQPPAESKTGALMKDAGLWLVLQCLSAIGNYQIDIHATPIGYVKQTFQASSNDYELQNMLKGTVIEQTIDEPLCHSLQECQKVADHEMSIVKAQRNRLKMTKIAHLQDEPGDKIRINHPYNQLNIDIFVTDITRTILIPDAGGEGYFKDEIEGWKV